MPALMIGAIRLVDNASDLRHGNILPQASAIRRNELITFISLNGIARIEPKPVLADLQVTPFEQLGGEFIA